MNVDLFLLEYRVRGPQVLERSVSCPGTGSVLGLISSKVPSRATAQIIQRIGMESIRPLENLPSGRNAAFRITFEGNLPQDEHGAR